MNESIMLMAYYSDSSMSGIWIIVYIALSMGVCLIFGAICKSILNNKGYPRYVNNGFAWGFFLTWIGLIVCLAKKEYNANGPVQTNNVTGIADEISKFKKLLDDGAITEAEYEAKKKQLLG